MNTGLPPGWRVTPLDVDKIAAHERNAHSLAAELRKNIKFKREVPTEWNGKPIAQLSLQEREDFYFSMQPESTKQAITAQRNRKPNEDAEYLLRPMPACLANPEAKTLDELTAKRQLSLEETLIEEGLRRMGRNFFNQSVYSSVDEEKRTKGIEAFTYSKPANPSDEDLKRLAKLNEMEAIVVSESPKQEPQPSWWERFKLRFWGKPHTWNSQEERKRLGLE